MNFFPPDLHRKHIDHLLEHRRLTLSGTGNRNAKAHFLGEVMKYSNPEQLKRSGDGIKTLLWVVEDARDAEKTAANMKFWTSLPVHNFALQDDEKLSDLHKMLRLYAFLKDERKVVVIDPQSLLSSYCSRQELEKKTLNLKVGQVFDSMEVINAILDMGYEFSDDEYLMPGSYCKQGGLLNVFLPTMASPVKIELDGVKIAGLYEFDQENKQVARKHKELQIVPLKFERETADFMEYLHRDCLLINDEVDLSPEFLLRMQEFEEEQLVAQNTKPKKEDVKKKKVKKMEKSIEEQEKPALVTFTSFPEEEDTHYFYLYYLSILKFQDVFDFLNDLREKQKGGWKVMIFSKHLEELKPILSEEKIRFSTAQNIDESCFLHLEDSHHLTYVPQSFQNPDLKVAILTDREIFDFRQIRRKVTKIQRKVNLEFLQSLNEGDFVVHVDHGIGKYIGIDQQEFDGMKREYLRISYAENDKLYVPIDQAEKVNKFVGIGSEEPKLTRLGSGEWATVQKKVKKETQEMAKELLLLYSKREMAKGFGAFPDDDVQEQFEKTFPYQETPGQLRAIVDVKGDMEKEKPMDRLVCGDVGFGKTEVAMRAAFKAVRSGKQVAVITPITILTDQHFKGFNARMKPFGVKVEMLSRFRSAAEQRAILKDISAGKIDIIVGTHRLLQPDIKFKDLGLVVIDEEQRFGVKQKEKLKDLRTSIDILTLTATPIPRTLNMSLNKLRDITIISTPPPGRLPIITEVRRFGDSLIKESIEREVARGGQVYFLHNRVQTIESMATKLKSMFPQLRIIVAHGKLKPTDLEERIMAFKKKEYDVLVSSTIIENGIDLPNANTLIVNNAEQFGLSQLYQLRGRIGRGKRQAYAYFLYHAQKLKSDAKRRLRAIVEASELGAGFQIAMHDLEIRGAGDILGASQSGTISVVGVNHFVRLLQQTVNELKAGKEVTQELEDLEKITIDLPITAFIPDVYIEESREKINAYQRFSSATRLEDLAELEQEFDEDYGPMPKEVKNLMKVLELKIHARNADIVALRNVVGEKGKKQIVLTMGKNMKPQQIGKLLDYEPKWQITGTSLKIPMQSLGFDWLQKLKKSLEVMSKRIQKKNPQNKEGSKDGKAKKKKNVEMHQKKSKKTA
ncbi:MAG: transcription-repair coupling factor [Candidatus Gracilibacteria bacterium]|nr:transcription-repair coupling factor [Candidatus Gracilibacteria bacterium]